MADPGRPVSIRFRPGDLALIRAATNRPAGEVVRELTAIYVDRLKLERQEESKG